MSAAERRATVLTNGTVRTLADPHAVAEAIGVVDGRIAAVGDRADVVRAVGPQPHTVDLAGGALLPGFIDPHVHIEDRDAYLGLLDAVPDEAELARRCAPIRAGHQPGEWISTNSEILGDWLDRHVLDRIFPSNPVLLIVGNAWSVLNTAALPALDLSRADQAGALIVRDPIDGAPNGRVKTIGSGQIKALLPNAPLYTVDTVAASVRRGIDRLLAAGITTTHHMIRDPLPVAAYRRLAAADQLRMRVGLIPRIYEAEYDLDEVATMMADPLPGERLSWQGVKISIDGYYGDLSARQHVPYAGTSDSHGRWRIDAATLNDLVLDSHRRGLRMCLHANGAAAVDAALDAYDGALSAVARTDHRHRIEHFGNEVLTDEQLRRCHELGVVVIPNPPVWFAETPRLRDHLAGNPAFRPLNLRRMLDEGLFVGLSGDNHEPQEPLSAVGALATRLLEDGSVDQPDQAVTPWETLRIYTAVNAWLGNHDRAGVLAPGMDADLVWVDADPLTTPVERIASIAVRGTMVAGAWEYEGDGTTTD